MNLRSLPSNSRLRQLFLIPAAWMLAIAAASGTARAETWAEKLGYPTDCRVVILDVREMGLAWEAN